MREMLKVISLAAMVPVLNGCLSIRSNEDLLVLERGRHDLKAVTSEDGRLRVREFRDSHGGDLGFWSKALKKDFLDRGYTLLEERDVKDDSGRDGREYLFQVDLDRSPQRYLVRVSVVERPLLSFDKYVRVAEFLASPEVYSGQEKSIRRALDGVYP